MLVDNIRFSEARAAVLSENRDRVGIGTLGEKLLHRTLKYYIDPDPSNHEIPVDRFVADLKNGEGIFEIQTGAPRRLLPKLQAFLPKMPVTVVFPLIAEKTISYFDRESGELTEPRRSPKHLRPCDALAQISAISDFIGNENLKVEVVLLTASEYRLLDGWDKRRHKGATKLDIIPDDIVDIITVRTVDDLRALLPSGLPETFCAKEFYKELCNGGRNAYFSLKLLEKTGIASVCGMRGRARLYTLK